MKCRYTIFDILSKNTKIVSVDECVELFKPKTHTGNQRQLDNIITFDTETTTSYHIDEHKRLVPEYGFVNMAQICIDGNLCYCRTIDEVKILFDKIDKKIKDTYKNRKKVPHVRTYVHNLGYDYQFFRNSFDKEFLDSKLLGDERTPISIEPKEYSIDFYCSLKLFDRKLEKVAEDYKLDYKKTKGWDYNKFRSPETKLSKDEIEYGMHDVYILYLALLEKIQEGQYGYIMHVPSTKTGEVRYYRKNIVGSIVMKYRNYEQFKKDNTKNSVDISDIKLDKFIKNEEYKALKYKDKALYHSGRKLKRNKNGSIMMRKDGTVMFQTILEHDQIFIKRCKDTSFYNRVYKLAQLAFQGGFTHARKDKLGRKLKKVASFDLTSAYPSVMLVKKFVYKWSRVITSLQKDDNGFIMNKTNGYLFKVHFDEVKAKSGISVISRSKILNDDTEVIDIDNGRILHAKNVELAMYDTDYNALLYYYTFTGEKLLEGYSGTKIPMLLSDILLIVHFYTDKCKYKYMGKASGLTKEQKDEINRKLTYAKQQLNSIYGCAATDYFKYLKPSDYNEMTKEEQEEVFEGFIKIMKDKRDVSVFSIGGQVTSYVRNQILTAIRSIGYNDFVYADTDSVKFLNYDIHKSVFEKINSEMQDEYNKAIKYFDIDITEWKEPMNKFDFEGMYAYFKTVGAKRYILVHENKDGSVETIKDHFTNKEGILDTKGIKETFKDSKYKLDDPFIECTVAGISKLDMLRYLQKAGRNTMERFAKFKHQLTISSKETSKLITHYVDNEDVTEMVVDSYRGQRIANPVKVSVGSYIIFTNATFNMGLAHDVIFAIKGNLAPTGLQNI